MALLALAFVWAYLMGIWLHEHVEAIKLKPHGRRARSLFRYGLDWGVLVESDEPTVAPAMARLPTGFVRYTEETVKILDPLDQVDTINNHQQ